MHLSFSGAKPFWGLSKYSKHTQIRTKGLNLRITWQKFATLIPKNTRTGLAKENQASL